MDRNLIIRQNILIVLAIVLLVGMFVVAKIYGPPQDIEDKKIGETYINERGETWGPLPQGEYDFQVVSTEGVWPKFLEGKIDPLDVRPGDVQKMKVVVQSPAGVTSVIADIETDNGTTTVHLERTGIVTFRDMMPERYKVENSAVKILSPLEIQTNHLAAILAEEKTLRRGVARASEGEKEVWEGEWVVRDTHSREYQTIFTAVDSLGRKSQLVMAWSDTCIPPTGGDWQVDDNCSFSAVHGVDNGNVTGFESNYNVTLNSTFAWNPAKSISINKGGSFSIGTGGQLRQTYLWMIDEDTDDYPTNTTQVAQDTLPGARYRRRNVLDSYSTTDCWDTSANIYRFVASLYTDVDRDRYTIGSAGTQCVGSYDGTWYRDLGGAWAWLPSSLRSGADCDDQSSLVQVNKTRYADGDGDNYTVTVMGVCASSDTGGCAANFSRLANNSCVLTSALSGGDCSDGNANIFQNIASLYNDSDRDRYTTGSAGTQCVGSYDGTWYRNSGGAWTWLPSGSRSGADCYDLNANAKPGQTSYFTTNRGDGSFDYNCDNSATRQWTQTGGEATSCFVAFDGCVTVTQGSTGWSGSTVPACGAAATYYTSPGPNCGPRWPDVQFCESDVSSSETRTQACR